MLVWFVLGCGGLREGLGGPEKAHGWLLGPPAKKNEKPILVAGPFEAAQTTYLKM